MNMPKTQEKTTKTKVKKSKKQTGWYELIQEKEEFKNIVRILNRYYNINPPNNHPSNAHTFREDIVQANLDDLRIFLKKFGNYEFLIVVEISSPKGVRMDSWIHIDGVSQERIVMKEKGKLDHPVFRIVSMEDLFLSHCKPVEKGFKPNVEDLIL